MARKKKNGPAARQSKTLEQATNRRPKVMIVGSCVTRDAFELPQAESFELVEYVARTSLASAFGPRLDYPTFEPLSSPFKDKMLRTDLGKQLSRLIRETAWDILIVDLIDERFDVITDGRGSATVSSSLLEAPELILWSQTLLRLPIDNEERQHLWSQGWRALINEARAANPTGKIVLNCAQWALRDAQGKRASASLELAMLNNTALRSMYRSAQAQTPDLNAVTYPSELLVADANHRWGLAPFHYVESLYDYFLDKLSAISK